MYSYLFFEANIDSWSLDLDSLPIHGKCQSAGKNLSISSLNLLSLCITVILMFVNILTIEKQHFFANANDGKKKYFQIDLAA